MRADDMIVQLLQRGRYRAVGDFRSGNTQSAADVYFNMTDALHHFLRQMIHCFASYASGALQTTGFSHRTNAIHELVKRCFPDDALRAFSIAGLTDHNFVPAIFAGFAAHRAGDDMTSAIETIVREFATTSIDMTRLSDDVERTVCRQMMDAACLLLTPRKRFMRHFLETGEYAALDIEGVFPPAGSFADHQGAWPLQLGVATWSSQKPGNQLLVPVDEGHWPQGELWGLLDLDAFDRFDGKIEMGSGNMERDHYYARASIPLREWVFVTNARHDIARTSVNRLITCRLVDRTTIDLLEGVAELLRAEILQLQRVRR